MNNAIIQLEQQIIDLINNANVPLAATCLILDKVSKEAQIALQQALAQEQEMQNDLIAE